jgi:hypothetical protein
VPFVARRRNRIPDDAAENMPETVPTGNLNYAGADVGSKPHGN